MPRGLVKNNSAMSQHSWRLAVECDTNRGRQRKGEASERTLLEPLSLQGGWTLARTVPAAG